MQLKEEFSSVVIIYKEEMFHVVLQFGVGG
jgi:hypothetical protein